MEKTQHLFNLGRAAPQRYFAVAVPISIVCFDCPQPQLVSHLSHLIKFEEGTCLSVCRACLTTPEPRWLLLLFPGEAVSQVRWGGGGVESPRRGVEVAGGGGGVSSHPPPPREQKRETGGGQSIE